MKKKVSVKRPIKNKSKKASAPKLGGAKIANSVAKNKPAKVASTTLSLPKCTIKYALALSDPFNPAARGACVPVGSGSSQKTHAFARFDVVIGSTGYGMVYLCPSTANNIPSFYYTNALFNGASNIPFATSATYGSGVAISTLNTGWVAVNHNGPYSVGNFVGDLDPPFNGFNPVAGKIVSCGARAQYTGTTLNESGLFYCYHDPSHLSVAGVTVGNLGGFSDTGIEAVTRKPCSLTVHAVNDEETVYPDVTGNSTSASETKALYPYSEGRNIWDTSYLGAGGVQAGVQYPGAGSNVGPVGCPVGVIYITGVAGQTVHLETVIHLEFSGLASAAAHTDTMSDPQGASMVRSAALTLRQEMLDKPMHSPWELMYSALKRGAGQAVKYAVPMIETALTSLLI